MIDKEELNVTVFSDDWADARYVEVTATSLVAAIRLAHRDYPEEGIFGRMTSRAPGSSWLG